MRSYTDQKFLNFDVSRKINDTDPIGHDHAELPGGHVPVELTLSGNYIRHQSFIEGPKRGILKETGEIDVATGLPVLQRIGKDGKPGAYIVVDKYGNQKDVYSPYPPTVLGQWRAVHNEHVADVKNKLKLEDLGPEAQVIESLHIQQHGSRSGGIHRL